MYFEAIVGRLYVSMVRDALNEYIIKGGQIKFYEGSGLLKKTFTISGSPEDLTNVRKYFEKIEEVAHVPGPS